MHPKLELFLFERERARARGDNGVVRSIEADLHRWGYVEGSQFATVPFADVVAVPTISRAEFAADLVERVDEKQIEFVAAEPEPAPRGRGRPPKPRCEHGQIVGRCVECDGDDV